MRKKSEKKEVKILKEKQFLAFHEHDRTIKK
jgi:hypothetical protein